MESTTFRGIFLTWITVFIVTFSAVNPRTTVIEEVPEHLELTRERREITETADSAPEGRTFRASDPLDPNIPAADAATAGNEELFGGNFEASHTIFDPAVGAEDGEGSDTPSEGTETAGEAGNPGTAVSGATNVRQSGGPEYVPGDFDRPEYVPGVVEAVRSAPDADQSRDTGSSQNGRSAGASQTNSGGSDPSSGSSYSSSPSSTRSGSSQTGTYYPSSSQSQTGTYFPWSSQGGSYPSGSQGRTSSYYRRRVVATGGSSSQYPPRSYTTGTGPGTQGARGYYPTGTGRQHYQTGSTTRRVIGGGSSSGSQPSSGYYQPSGSGTVYPTTGYGYYYGNENPSNTGYNTGGQTGTGSTQDGSSGSYGGSAGTSVIPGGNQSPIASYISPDTTCQPTQSEITINGMSCSDAIRNLGSFVCYYHERASQDCCQRCLQVKDSSRVGCEYGDRSYQCRNIEPFDCYSGRNRDICCNRCRQFAEQRRSIGSPGCEYGDLTPRCQSIRERRHLCYLPENQRLCCVTCPALESSSDPDCRWGDQNPELCAPFDSRDRVRINCYLYPVQQLCCSSCKRLRDRMRAQIPGCAYGDSPVQFSTERGILGCREFVMLYGADQCSNQEVATKCCQTCYGYVRDRVGLL